MRKKQKGKDLEAGEGKKSLGGDADVSTSQGLSMFRVRSAPGHSLFLF